MDLFLWSYSMSEADNFNGCPKASDVLRVLARMHTPKNSQVYLSFAFAWVFERFVMNTAPTC